MIKFLTITDPHFAGVGPKAYLPNPGAYKQDILAILSECADLAKEHSCAAVLMPGDLTNSHIMSLAVLREFIDALKKFPCPIFTVSGTSKHDKETTDMGDLNAAPYGVLEAAEVIRDVYNYPWTNGTVKITGHPQTEETDQDITHYCIPQKSVDRTGPWEKHIVRIHLTHGMLLPDHLWYITDKENKTDREGRRHKYTTFEELAALPKEKLPDIIINGHFHGGHEATYLPNGTLIVNYGAICRLSRSVDEIKRTLRVGLIVISGPGQDGKINYKATPIILKSQRPGEACLNREELEREIERAKTKDKMGEFLSLLGTKREIRVRDARVVVAEAVEELGKAGKLIGVGVGVGGAGAATGAEEVKRRCLERLDRVSGAMEAKEEGAAR